MKDVFTSGDIKAMDAHEIALHNNELELIRHLLTRRSGLQEQL